MFSSIYNIYLYLSGSEEDNYDAVEEPNRASGDLYGDINEDTDLQIVQNPYYGDVMEMGDSTQALNNTQVITAQTNIYYE